MAIPAPSIKTFLNKLVFDASDWPVVNQHILLGCLWWADDLPDGQPWPRTGGKDNEFAVFDKGTKTIIGWDLADMDKMVKKVAKGSQNGSSARTIISQMMPDDPSTSSWVLDPVNIDHEFGSTMLQFWAWNEVRY